EELAEFDVARAKPLQGGCDTPEEHIAARAFDHAPELQRELCRRRKRRRVDDPEHALAREHQGRARQPCDMNDRSDHKRQPECSVTMPADIVSNETREKPAARIMSAKAVGFG